MDSQHRDRVERNLRELHEYGRHTTAALITFFAFFMTLNFASMGVLVSTLGKPDNNTLPPRLVIFVALLFCGQCVFTIAGLLAARTYLTSLPEQIARHISLLEPNSLEESARVGACFPEMLYHRVPSLMIATVSMILLGWITFPIILICSR